LSSCADNNLVFIIEPRRNAFFKHAESPTTRQQSFLGHRPFRA
jgi:hypothetical protein